MRYPLHSKQRRPSFRQLFAACISAVVLTGVSATLQAEEPPDTRDRFLELDSEIQAIKAEILAINRDILLLEELSLYPHGQQLIVLVSIGKGSPVNPQRITLQLDGQTVSQHDYTASENAALEQGGVHRLYTGGLTEGKHRLDVALSGRGHRDKAFTEERSVTITKELGRKYLELQVGLGDARSEPGLTIREWQQ